MNRIAKVFLVLVTCFAVLFVGSGLLLAATVAATGLVTVEVDQATAGPDVYLPIPAIVLQAGIALLPAVLPDEERAEIRAELGEYRPLVLGVLEELAACPDAVLVDVEDGAEHVRIVKEGRDLTVHVESPDANVEISLPARLLPRLIAAI